MMIQNGLLLIKSNALIFKNILGNKKAMQTKQNAVHVVDCQNSGPTLNFLGDFTHAHDQFCDATVRDRIMPAAMKATHSASTHNVLSDSSLSDVKMCLNGSG